MHAEALEWAGVLLGIGGLFFAGMKFILNRIDRRAKREREWQRSERTKLETAFTSRIDTLEGVVTAQQQELRFLQGEVHRHIRHVGVLEGLLRANGIPVPTIEPVVVLSGEIAGG